MAHYIEVTIDPDGNPDSPYAWDRWDMSAIECSTPGGCGGWRECTLDHPGMDTDDEDSPAFDAEEWEIHGIWHKWGGGEWTVPFDGCAVREWADTNDLWDCIDGPGRYRVDDEWDDTECHLAVVEKVADQANRAAIRAKLVEPEWREATP